MSTNDNHPALRISLNLDEILSGDEYGTTIGELFREALKAEIAKQLKVAVKESKDLKRAIAALQANAVQRILAACEESK